VSIQPLAAINNFSSKMVMIAMMTTIMMTKLIMIIIKTLIK